MTSVTQNSKTILKIDPRSFVLENTFLTSPSVCFNPTPNYDMHSQPLQLKQSLFWSFLCFKNEVSLFCLIIVKYVSRDIVGCIRCVLDVKSFKILLFYFQY